MNNKLRSVIIGVVTAVWAMNFTAPIFVHDYKPSPELNVAFMAIIGVLTASYRMDKQQHEAPEKPALPATEESAAKEEQADA
jgi:hypothetical protein